MARQQDGRDQSARCGSKYIRGPIAIDGPAASGKSTVARLLAERLQGSYVSTGELYRAVGAETIRRGIDPEREEDQIGEMLECLDLACDFGSDGGLRIHINGRHVPSRELYSPEVAAVVSQVAAVPSVRSWLIECQRAIARRGLTVLEGRDIGTVILPDAPHKFFLTATPEERAKRRLAQGGDAPDGATIDAVAAQIAERDRIDSTRKVAPLRPAADAVVVDCSSLSIEETVDAMARIIEENR